ncbi:SGNH hydrolase protein [Dioscorea alata]|uniref:SGNH hydrolase protein n=1 Tax=Dioscorea alata TaxID=55571 RepID=A0ACB7WGB1_DIOAL|nr:SGNH hydrolase protein [Dioscorea alata]
MLPILLLLFLTALSPSQSDPGSPSKLIFILAGQSNMAGRGGVVNTTWDHIIPPESSPNPSILRLNAHLQWEPAHEPLHADIDVLKTCGVGPGMAFANAVRSGGCEGEIGLVPCAIGGTTISEWERGQGLYERMVRRAKAAVEEGGGRVGAVLWYQGESDTEERAEAEAYAGRMARLVRDLREDLGQPGLLVIQVALASGEGNFTEIVREAQKGIKLPNVLCVDAEGLALEEDHLHLTTHAQVHLGKMLAAAYLGHVKPHLESLF